MHVTFGGWPPDGPAFLAEIAADNSAGFWAAHHPRHAAAVLAPMRALAIDLQPEFGPIRVFRPQVNRRFRPEAPPYRTDTGGVARSPGGCALAVVLTASTLAVTVGHRSFDVGQLRRYRDAVHLGDGDLGTVLAGLSGLDPEPGRPLTGLPRGFRADHPRIGLLRCRGLEVAASWAVGPWLATPEPLERVRVAWRAAAPLVAWLDEHVGPPAPAASDPRPVRRAEPAATADPAAE